MTHPSFGIRPPSTLASYACVVFVLLLTACAYQSGEPKPPEIAYGQEVCDSCGMLISEARFAAATLLENGETRKFDDLSEMFSYHMDHPDLTVRAWFVHDYESEGWIRGETAFYVLDEEIKSPMGHGMAAFENREKAEKMAAELGVKVYTFDEARVEIHMKVHG